MDTHHPAPGEHRPEIQTTIGADILAKKTIDHYRECPFCGSRRGYYTRDRYRVLINRGHGFTGEKAGNCKKRMRDYIPGKRAYCINCELYIAPTRRLRRA